MAALLADCLGFAAALKLSIFLPTVANMFAEATASLALSMQLDVATFVSERDGAAAEILLSTPVAPFNDASPLQIEFLSVLASINVL